jgi:hypothetical protein
VEGYKYNKKKLKNCIYVTQKDIDVIFLLHLYHFRWTLEETLAFLRLETWCATKLVHLETLA